CPRRSRTLCDPGRSRSQGVRERRGGLESVDARFRSAPTLVPPPGGEPSGCRPQALLPTGLHGAPDCVNMGHRKTTNCSKRPAPLGASIRASPEDTPTCVTTTHWKEAVMGERDTGPRTTRGMCIDPEVELFEP